MKNLQLIEIRCLASTNTSKARLKLVDLRFNVSVTMARDYNVNCITDQAIKFLSDRGFNVVAKTYNEVAKVHYILLDTFEPINQQLISNNGYYETQVINETK